MIGTGFSDSGSLNRSISSDDLARFHRYWIQYDPEATCILAADKLADFYLNLYAPLGCGREMGDEETFNNKICTLPILLIVKEN